MPDLFPASGAAPRTPFKRSATDGMQQQPQAAPPQQRRRTASQPELEVFSQQLHSVALEEEDCASECSSANSSSMDFQERCSAAVAEGLGPRAEAGRFVAPDGAFDWELYNWVFVRALDQRLANLGMQQRSASCMLAAVSGFSQFALPLLSTT